MALELTAAQVQALAPDAAAVAAGRKLGKPGPWRNLGRSEAALWGECQGSARYQTQVALADLATRCTCPSRKFPCKHGLGLLFLAVDAPAGFPSGTEPEWVSGWLARRDEAQQKKAARADGDAGDRPVDAAAQARRSERRHDSITAGLDQLDSWMADLVRQGLARAQAQSPSFWDAQARRLIDAQAPGFAARVRHAGARVGAGDDWAQRLLDDLGSLALLSHAWRRLDALGPALAADVRRIAGITLDQAEVIAHGDLVEDRWQVIAGVVEDDERMRVQRSWLRGKDSGRVALVLQFAVGGTRFAEALPPGTRVGARLAFWPGACPQRALIVERTASPEPMAGPPPGEDVSAALDRFATLLAKLPWIDRELLVLDAVVPVVATTWRVTDARGRSLPLHGTRHDLLLAASGGHPITVAGEWDGYGLWPLAAWSEGRPVPLVERARMSELLRTAILGTGQTPPASERADGGPVDELVARAVDMARPGRIDRERALLLQAGGEAILRRAARQHADVAPAGPAAAPEVLRPTGARLADLLRRAFDDGPTEVLIEALQRMGHAGIRLPEALLPVALGRGGDETRAALRPVMGERGRWLARQREEWAWALAPSLSPDHELSLDADARFADGTAAERRTLLAIARRADPPRARRWIESGWKQEKAEQRLAFLQVMGTGIAAEDEPLLEAMLGDRSTAVRLAAAQLAWRIPGSAIAERVSARVEALVSHRAPATGGLVGRLRSMVGGAAAGTLEVTLPPDTWDPGWSRDGFVEQPPQGVGRRQFWLAQLLVAVSPARLAERLAVAPAQLVSLAASHELAAALLDGMTAGALHHHAHEFYAPLWDWWRSGGDDRASHLTAEPLEALTPRLSPGDLEPRAVALVEGEEQLKLLHLVPRPWPERLSRAVLARLDEVRPSWTWLVPAAALGIAPEHLPEHLPVPPIPDGAEVDFRTRAALRLLDQLQSIARLRRNLHQEIRS